MIGIIGCLLLFLLGVYSVILCLGGYIYLTTSTLDPMDLSNQYRTRGEKYATWFLCWPYVYLHRLCNKLSGTKAWERFTDWLAEEVD